MVYDFKGPSKDIDFDEFIDAETLFGEIKSTKNKIWRCRKKSNRIWIETK